MREKDDVNSFPRWLKHPQAIFPRLDRWKHKRSIRIGSSIGDHFSRSVLQSQGGLQRFMLVAKDTTDIAVFDERRLLFRLPTSGNTNRSEYQTYGQNSAHFSNSLHDPLADIEIPRWARDVANTAE